MCISQFLIESEALSPVYPTDWNVFLQDSEEYFMNTAPLKSVVQDINVGTTVRLEDELLDISQAA
jgi:hypothetical protein